LTWTVEFEESAAKELRRLDKQIQREILNYFRQRIATDEDPRRYGKPLSRELAGYYPDYSGPQIILPCRSCGTYISPTVAKLIEVQTGSRTTNEKNRTLSNNL